jgi:hypothetical protein
MQPFTLLAKRRGRRAGGKTSLDNNNKEYADTPGKVWFFLTISEGKSGDV